MDGSVHVDGPPLMDRETAVKSNFEEPTRSRSSQDNNYPETGNLHTTTSAAPPLVNCELLYTQL